MDKSIYEKQSNTLIIQCLFAQKNKYSQAKMVACLYFILCVVAVCVFTVLKSITNNGVITGLSIGLSVATFFASFPINNIVSKIKTEASNIQQYIDVTLYSSNQYSHLNDKWKCPLTQDHIIEMVSKYPKSGFTDNDKWYEDYSSHNYCKQVILCQKENIRWDGNLRKKYHCTYKGILWGIIILIFVFGVIIDPSFTKIISIVPWCMPFIKYLCSFEKHIQEDENRITKLKNEADSILSYIDMDLNGEECMQKEIILQNGIFEHRKNALLIPNFFYRICRPKQQKIEESIAKNYQKVDGK